RISAHFGHALVILSTAVAVGLVAVSTKVRDLGPVPSWTLALVAGGLILAITFILLPPMISTRSCLTVAAAALLVLGTASSITFVDGWARWNYEGYELK